MLSVHGRGCLYIGRSVCTSCKAMIGLRVMGGAAARTHARTLFVWFTGRMVELHFLFLARERWYGKHAPVRTLFFLNRVATSVKLSRLLNHNQVKVHAEREALYRHPKPEQASS